MNQMQELMNLAHRASVYSAQLKELTRNLKNASEYLGNDGIGGAQEELIDAKARLSAMRERIDDMSSYITYKQFCDFLESQINEMAHIIGGQNK